MASKKTTLTVGPINVASLFQIRVAANQHSYSKRILPMKTTLGNGKNSRDGEKAESQASTLVALAG
ncbi:MAG: hypothetical protein DWI22_19185, partial [Planctomycetota bacterium]